MRFHFTWAVMLVFALTAMPVRAADWSIDVVPSNSANGKGEKGISLHWPFYVVLTNVTDHDLTVWKEWCSDGYFNLSFEFTGKDGKVIHVQKMGRDWAKNFPDPFVVAPGKHFVLAVTLRTEIQQVPEWDGTENLGGKMTLQAIYQNGSMSGSAWAGKVESEPMQVTITR